jgi:hypothetical protein
LLEFSSLYTKMKADPTGLVQRNAQPGEARMDACIVRPKRFWEKLASAAAQSVVQFPPV